MGIQERKIREKERIRQLIITSAQKIVLEQGVNGLTMRAIAQDIEYSQSKLYEYFASKDALCEALCEVNCHAILEQLQKLKPNQAAQYLTDLVMTTMEFHVEHPHSDELLTLVCFAPERFNVPASFLEIESLFMTALKALKSPFLANDKDVTAALDTIRCLFIGVSTLMVSDVGSHRERALAIVNNAVQALLRGWMSK